MSDQAEAEVAAPSFLDSKYFEEILQKYYRDGAIKVLSIKIGYCGEPNDGFASTMYRVVVRVDQGNKKVKRGNYIVKMMPTLQLAIDKLGGDGYNVQEKEMDIFQRIFPEFKKILREIGEDKNVFPSAVAVDRIRNVLVMEDLKDKKFVLADRKVGLDLNHIKLSLNKLARFHAASMVLMEKSPEIFDNYDVGMFSRKTSSFHDFFSSNMDALINEVSTWEGFEAYVEKLRKLKGNMYEACFKAFDNDPGDMKVLLHGDLWVNNMMFAYDQHGSLADAIIVS